MTAAEQARADAVSPEHLAALERWDEVADEHAAIFLFLEWLRGQGWAIAEPAGPGRAPVPNNKRLANLYLGIDEALLDDARRALLGGQEQPQP